MGLLDGIIGPVVDTILGVINGDGPAVLQRSGRVYNPDTGEDTATGLSWTIKLSPPSQAAQLFTDAQGVSMVQKTGMVFIVSIYAVNDDTGLRETITVNPKTDSIVFSGHTFNITNVYPLYSGTEVAAWKVEVMR